MSLKTMSSKTRIAGAMIGAGIASRSDYAPNDVDAPRCRRVRRFDASGADVGKGRVCNS